MRARVGTREEVNAFFEARFEIGSFGFGQVDPHRLRHEPVPRISVTSSEESSRDERKIGNKALSRSVFLARLPSTVTINGNVNLRAAPH